MDAEFEGVPVSATDNYTPTTEAVRKIYTAAPIVKESNRLPDSDIAKNGVRFDRWLAAERAKAWDEGKAEMIRYQQGGKTKVPYPANPYREVQ